LKILYFSEGYSPHDFRFLSALSGTDYEVYFLKLFPNLIYEHRPIPKNIHQTNLSNSRRNSNWFNYFHLREEFSKIIEKNKPDLVHAGPIQKVAFIPALSGFHPLISMSWGTDLLMEADRSVWYNWVTKYTLHHTDVMVGDCLSVQKKAEKFGFLKEKIFIFPWGIDLEKYRPAQKRKGRKKGFTILCTRNWEKRYGVDVVVKAFCFASTQMPESRLLLIGGGSQAYALKEIVEQRNCETQVMFLGRIEYDTLPNYYQDTDLYISASHSDGSSVSLMEALGCGCPVLVSDIPSNMEWVQPGDVGWLFRDNDENDLAEKMISIYQKKDQLSAFRKRARQLAELKADWNKNFLKLLIAYDTARN
jgi:glycosyltransferase involved in cell wall biosynthesis